MKILEHALISIRPHYAAAILAGTKTVELRRRIPFVAPGTCLWIYATLPVGAVIGSAIVSKVFRSTPDRLWAKYASASAIGKSAYNRYFEGTDDAVGLLLNDVRHGTAVDIDRLRIMRPGFHPPQVMLRLSESEADYLSQLSSIFREAHPPAVKRRA